MAFGEQKGLEGKLRLPGQQPSTVCSRELQRPVGKVRLVGTVRFVGAAAIASNAAHRAWALSLPWATSRSADLETAMRGAETLRTGTLQMETPQTEKLRTGVWQIEVWQMGVWASFRWVEAWPRRSLLLRGRCQRPSWPLPSTSGSPWRSGHWVQARWDFGPRDPQWFRGALPRPSAYGLPSIRDDFD